MTDDMCYIIISWTIDDIFRIHGIFTHNYLQKHGKDISIDKWLLKNKVDNVKTYIIPLNHFVEKGMIV